jgi:hypothetical protein
MGVVASAFCCATSCCTGGVSCCASAGRGASAAGRQAAKASYVALLGLATILAWVLQRYGPQLGVKVGQLDFDCSVGDGNQVCSNNGVVYRISLMLVVFFGACMLGSVPLPTLTGERRWAPLLDDGFHRGWWALKVVVFVGLLALTVLLPSSVFDAPDNGYAWACRVVSSVFLVWQVLTLVDFAFQWNQDWVDVRAYEGGDVPKNKGWLYGVLVCALVLNALAVGGMILLFTKYGECSQGRGYVIVTAIAYAVYTVLLTLFREQLIGEPGAVLPASVVALYTVFLVWSAIESLPNPGCRPFDNGSDLVVFAGVAFAAVSLVWTSYTASARTQRLLGGGEQGSAVAVQSAGEDFGGLYAVGTDADGKEVLARDVKARERTQGASPDVEEQQNVAPSSNKNDKLDDKPWLFFLFLTTGSMYMAMLLTNWGVTDASAGTQNNIGEVSFWVKIVSEWACIALFVWCLVAPRVLPNREFSY